MAAYRPYCGGMPASVAKATPWGSTTTAPVKPASRSARRPPGWRHSSCQRRMGRRQVTGMAVVEGARVGASRGAQRVGCVPFSAVAG